MRSPREISESYWAAECRRDVDAVMAHYHADGTFEDAGGLRRGHAEVRAAYEESAAAFPGLEVTIVREFKSDDPDLGALEYDAYLIDAQGGRHRVRGVNVVRVQDGKFVSVRSFEDPPALV